MVNFVETYSPISLICKFHLEFKSSDNHLKAFEFAKPSISIMKLRIHLELAEYTGQDSVSLVLDLESAFHVNKFRTKRCLARKRVVQLHFTCSSSLVIRSFFCDIFSLSMAHFILSEAWMSLRAWTSSRSCAIVSASRRVVHASALILTSLYIRA